MYNSSYGLMRLGFPGCIVMPGLTGVLVPAPQICFTTMKSCNTHFKFPSSDENKLAVFLSGIFIDKTAAANSRIFEAITTNSTKHWLHLLECAVVLCLQWMKRMSGGVTASALRLCLMKFVFSEKAQFFLKILYMGMFFASFSWIFFFFSNFISEDVFMFFPETLGNDIYVFLFLFSFFWPLSKL